MYSTRELGGIAGGGRAVWVWRQSGKGQDGEGLER